MSSGEYLVCIIGMGLVTYIPRWLPLFYLTDKRLPLWLVEWLTFIPACILSALIFPSIIINPDTGTVDFMHPAFLAAIPTFLFALKTRSLGGTVIVGMSLYWLLQHFL
ncbi:MAG TPA: AzlD domain-containing protein [Deltaproteobacteria bacterium]|nr:AzlD domain-containing protein [Deltaproteobacteria bacterium]